MTAQEHQLRGQEEDSISASAARSAPVPEPEVDPSDTALSEAEVAQVKRHIAEALGVASHSAEEYTGASLYYDASTMAPLNSFSLVSLCLLHSSQDGYFMLHRLLIGVNDRPPSTDSEHTSPPRSRYGTSCRRASEPPSWCCCLRIDGVI